MTVKQIKPHLNILTIKKLNIQMLYLELPNNQMMYWDLKKSKHFQISEALKEWNKYYID